MFALEKAVDKLKHKYGVHIELDVISNDIEIMNDVQKQQKVELSSSPQALTEHQPRRK